MSILRSKREAKGISLMMAAETLGIDPGNLSRIETGKQRPRLERAEKIAEFYGVTLLTVLYGEERSAA